MASENRSHQATPRRRQKAREQGRVPRSRELGPSLAIIGMVFLLSWQMSRGVGEWKGAFRELLSGSAKASASPFTGFVALNHVAMFWMYPALALSMGIACVVSVSQGGFVFAPGLLRPQLNRISPASKVQQLLSLSAVGNFAKALVPTAAISYLLVTALTKEWVGICGG
jgi:flagellar biosynthesis protein FlhB